MIVRFTIKLAIIQGKTSKLKEKPARLRQNQKRGLPKIGQKKEAVISIVSLDCFFFLKLTFHTVFFDEMKTLLL